MTTHSSILAWKIPWTGAWWATANGVTKVSDTTNQRFQYACILTYEVYIDFAHLFI